MSLKNVTPTTELEAVNTLLATIGEAPVATLVGGSVDVTMAMNALRSALRQVCSQRWRFNSEYNFTISPNGTSEGVNVFQVPPKLATFDLARTPEQRGLEAIIRKPRTSGGSSLIFADRLTGADGFDLPALKINPVWLVDFEDCPESARRYVTLLAAKAFQAQAVGSEILFQINQGDIDLAAQALQEDQSSVAQVALDGTPQTETDAVNLLLMAVGEDPVVDVEVAPTRGSSRALNVLRQVTKETLARRWRFNSEFNYTLTPSDSYEEDGVTYFVYKAPEGLSSFTLSRTSGQDGMDVIERPSRRPGLPPMILADRLSGRDGFTVDTLKINPVWSLTFEQCPEYIRSYIVTVTVRRYLSRFTQGTELPGFTPEDEAQALQEAVAEDTRDQAPVVEHGVPQSEVGALNMILTAFGMEPVVHVEALNKDSADALNFLRDAVREVCAEGWRFNTEHGLEITPVGSYEWEGRIEGWNQILNVFQAPDNLLSFTVTTHPSQQGNQYLDTAIRPSREFLLDGKAINVFYDRHANRDGFARDYIYINPVWLLGFEELPEEARHYATILATRRFAMSRGLGNPPFDERDEAMARRALKRSHGSRDNYNIFDNTSTTRVLGGRPLGPAGAWDFRATFGRGS